MGTAAAKRRKVEAGRERKFVTALARGLEVLRAFGAGDRQLGNQEIAVRTGLPKPTVSRLTYTLTQLGYLRQLPADGKYALGAAVLGLGLAAIGQMDVRRIARPLMQALAEHTHGSVNLGVRDQLGMIYIDTYRQASSYTVQLDVGSRVPLATSSMGRAWLAAAPERLRRAGARRGGPQGRRAGGARVRAARLLHRHRRVAPRDQRGGGAARVPGRRR